MNGVDCGVPVGFFLFLSKAYCLAQEPLSDCTDSEHAALPFPVLLVLAVVAFQRAVSHEKTVFWGVSPNLI